MSLSPDPCVFCVSDPCVSVFLCFNKGDDMDIKKWFKKLDKLEQGTKSMLLPDNDSEKGYGWETAEETVLEILSGDEEYTLVSFPFGELNEYHTHFYYHYARTVDECAYGQCKQVKREFALAAAYGYLDKAFTREFAIKGKNATQEPQDVVFVLHQVIMAGWWKQAETVMDWLMQDILKKDPEKMTFIDFNYPIVTKMAWFILRLSAKVFDYKLDDSYYPFLQSENPPEWKIYAEVIANWDTQDLNEVDKYAYQLCDLYIIDGAINEMPTNKDFTDSESFTLTDYMNPYPVLTWLKLREYKGLKNPKKFSHDLMNHPLAIYFEDPLEKPRDLPFVKELVAFLLTKEPNFPLPDSFIE